MEEKKINGWLDIKISPDMPLTAIVEFFNVLNQRVATIESLIKTNFEGKELTLTEIYKIQTERAIEEQKKAQAESEKKGA